MRKLKTLLIAFLCAVTTIVTLGAVNSFTARADGETTEYVYQDSNVTGIEKANDTRLGFVVSGSDYEGHSNYNNGKNYATISGLNTFAKIKVNGEAIENVYDGEVTDPYLNLWTKSPSYVFQQTAFAMATEITVEAGCEFPSYALWSGEGNVVYRTTEDVTFNKVGSLWVKYVDSSITAVIRAGSSTDRYGFVPDGNDYEGHPNYNGPSKSGKDYTNISGLNTLTKIKIGGNALAETSWNGATNDPYLNLWTPAPAFVMCQSAFIDNDTLTIEAGCEFPSYELWAGVGSTVYRTTEDITYVKKNGFWTRYEETSVTAIATSQYGNDRYGFVIAGSDYEGRKDYNYKDSQGNKNYDSISALNTLTKIKIDGNAIADTTWDGDLNDPYIGLWDMSNSFVFKQTAFATASEITIEAGCEFPSYGLWSGTGSVAYKTTETVTFRKVGDTWYKVYTATFVDEEGNKLGESTFTTADAALIYPDYDADPAYDYAWTGNEIKAENITVTLTKTIKTFDVKIGDAETVKYNYGTKIAKPETDPEKAADAEYTYTFAGWYNGETAWNFETDVVTENVTLTARFDKTAITYSLTFKKADGTEIIVEYTTLTRAEKLAELKNLLHEDDAQYAYENNLPEELPFENGRTYEEKRTVKKYTVTIGDGAPEEIEYGAKLTKPATDPVKEEDDEYTYTFKGWYNGETEWNFETDVVTGNVTLTAKFDSVKKQTESNSGETSGETGGESGSGADSSSGSGGCFGSVASGLPFVSILLLAGAVIVKIKKKD